VQYPSWMLQIGGPWSASGTTWLHDPQPVLQALDVPILWILAAQDTDAPIEETRDRLMALAAQNHPITVVSFPESEHGMREFEVDEDGGRIFTRYSEGYFRIVADWALNQRLSSTSYGRMEVLANGAGK
jgi:pimeloyl-ACP methyl ester carboxylesterase